MIKFGHEKPIKGERLVWCSTCKRRHIIQGQASASGSKIWWFARCRKRSGHARLIKRHTITNKWMPI